MSTDTRKKVLNTVRTIFAHFGPAGVSMRTLGEKVGVAQSVLYYYFPNKSTLLKAMFDETNTELGKLRAELPPSNDFHTLLKQRIGFQFDHAESVTAILKYYLYKRKTFPKNKDGGFVPDKAALHIEEILQLAKKQKILAPYAPIGKTAKIVTHAINGFVLEYFPHKLTNNERQKLIQDIARFLYPALCVPKRSQTKKGGEQL